MYIESYNNSVNGIDMILNSCPPAYIGAIQKIVSKWESAHCRSVHTLLKLIISDGP